MSRSLDTTQVVAVLKYTASLGPVPGRPDLKPFDFRTFEVLIRKHHKHFWCDFKPDPLSGTIQVSLCYHPNIGNIKLALGGLTQLIQVLYISTTNSM